jgi:hypothetical protein
MKCSLKEVSLPVITIELMCFLCSQEFEKDLQFVRKIKDREQRTDIGNYSFVNRTIKNWTQLPAEVLGTLTCEPKIFRRELRKQL